jgi:hypothetical protein
LGAKSTGRVNLLYGTRRAGELRYKKLTLADRGGLVATLAGNGYVDVINRPSQAADQKTPRRQGPMM